MSDDGIYALDFLTKKALLSRNIDSQQSVIIGLLRDGGFLQTNAEFESLISHMFGQIFSKTISRLKSAFLVRKSSA